MRNSFQRWARYMPIFGCLFMVYAAHAQTPDFITDSLDQWVKREMIRWDVPGLAVCIIKDGKMVVEKGFGVRNTATAQPVDKHTLFMIASNSKIFAGTLLSQLETEGKLKLTDTVQRWLPWFELADGTLSARVNITDLMTHRLGLQTFQGDLLHWANSNLSATELVRRMRFMPLRKPFRASYGYCNVGFIAAGLIMKETSGEDWHDAVTKRIFQPLQMKGASTTFEGISKSKNACTPYTLVNGMLEEVAYPNLDIIGPAASINASVHDIGKWLTMQLDSGRYNGNVVFPWETIQRTREAYTIMRTVANKDMPSKHIQVYGLGWYMSDYAGTWVLEHGGGADGFVTTTAIVPEAELGIAVFTNTDMNSLYNALKLQILDAYLGLPYKNYSELYFERVQKGRVEEVERLQALEVRRQQHKTTGVELHNVTGSFYQSHLGLMKVWMDDGGELRLKLNDHPELSAVLKPLGGDSFLCQWAIATYGVHEAKYDKTSATWHIKANNFVDYETYLFQRIN